MMLVADAATPLLYQFGTCPHSKTVRSVLAYKRVPYRREEVPLFGRTALRRASQQEWPPVLLHNGHVLVHVRSIVSYLEATFPARPVVPADAQLRAECFLLAHWIEKALHYLIAAVKFLNPANRTVAVASVRRNYPAGHSHWLASLLPVGQRFRLARFGYRVSQLPAIERAFSDCCVALDTRLEGRRFLVGDTVSCADMGLYAAFWTLQGCAEEAVICSLPNLAAWRERIAQERDWVEA